MTLPPEFADEAEDLLGELEETLLELQDRPGDAQIINRAFRSLHSFKGACNMFDLGRPCEVTHEMESLFDAIRSGRTTVDNRVLSLGFAFHKLLTDFVAAPQDGLNENAAEVLQEGCAEVMQGDNPAHQVLTEPSETQEPADAPAPAALNRYHVLFDPRGYRFYSIGADAVVDELLAFGNEGDGTECLLRADATQVGPLEDQPTDTCAIAWEFLLTTRHDALDVEGVFMLLQDPSGMSTITPLSKEAYAEARDTWYEDAAALAPATPQAPLAPFAPAAEPVTEPVAPSSDDSVATSSDEPQGYETAAAAPPTTAEPAATPPTAKSEQAPPPQTAPKADPPRKPKEPQAPAAAPKQVASLRVSTDKLDTLVDLVGELVIAQSRLTQITSGKDDPSLVAVTEEIERLCEDLRSGTLGLRMLPIGSTFNKYRRLTRDLSSELDKKVRLETEGGDTELDKTVIEKLQDPLVHILRNAMDHGVESPAERLAAGKPEEGIITLAARQMGGEVVIEIADDGKGIDRHRVCEKAIQRGVLPPDRDFDDEEVFACIFDPGFSTSENVTAVSGRGVGMDVVKRAIESLRGSITIASTPGEGTTFTIKLPLTLAIIEGLMVSVDGEYYVIPLSDVEECIEHVRTGEVTTSQSQPRSDGADMLNLRGDIVPSICLRSVFASHGARPSIEQVVIVHTASSRYGLVVDDIVGQHQTVIKSLGRVYGHVDGFSGATIMGDGSMALILDVGSLTTVAERANRVSFNPASAATGS